VVLEDAERLIGTWNEHQAKGMADAVLADDGTTADGSLTNLSRPALSRVFLTAAVAPANPQDYNPETYLYLSFLAITAVILVFAVLWTILPPSDDLRRRWYLTSARAELRDLLAGRRSRHGDDDALYRDADRVGQLAALQPADGDERRDDLRQALNIFGLAAATRRIQTALAKLSGQTDAPLIDDGYSALADSSAPRLRETAALLAVSAATQGAQANPFWPPLAQGPPRINAKITRCTLYGVDVARIYAFSSSFFGVGTIPANTEIQVHSWLHNQTMTAKAISLKTIMIASPPHGGRRS
jgi:Fusaric acid resistance protein family